MAGLTIPVGHHASFGGSITSVISPHALGGLTTAHRANFERPGFLDYVGGPSPVSPVAFHASTTHATPVHGGSIVGPVGGGSMLGGSMLGGSMVAPVGGAGNMYGNVFNPFLMQGQYPLLPQTAHPALQPGFVGGFGHFAPPMGMPMPMGMPSYGGFGPARVGGSVMGPSNVVHGGSVMAPSTVVHGGSVMGPARTIVQGSSMPAMHDTTIIHLPHNTTPADAQNAQ